MYSLVISFPLFLGHLGSEFSGCHRSFPVIAFRTGKDEIVPVLSSMAFLWNDVVKGHFFLCQ